MSNLYHQNMESLPDRAPSPHIWTKPDAGRRYLEKLLEEKKLAFSVQGLPICNNLLNQEIMRVSQLIPNNVFYDFERQLGSPNLSNPLGMMPDSGTVTLGPLDGISGWSPLRHQGNAAPGSSSSLITKKFVRLDVPVDKFPNVNFVGRLLGPKGNSLKRIETFTGCRVFIRGRGSIKDQDKEERMRGKRGYEHLNEPLHVLIEAVSHANIVDAQLRRAQEIIEDVLETTNKARDPYKRQQLQELAMLNSYATKDPFRPSSSATPCNSGATKLVTRPSSSSSGVMKPATTGWQGIW